MDSNTLITDLVTSYRASPPDCIILDKRVFEYFVLADEPFIKAIRIFELVY